MTSALEANKKIVHLTSAHNTNDTRIFQRQAKSLVEAGYDVTLMTVGSSNYRGNTEGVRIVVVSGSRKMRARLFRSSFKLMRTALKENADLYHFHDPELMLWAIPLVLAGRRVVMDLHEDFPATVYGRKTVPKWARRPLSWLMTAIIWLSCKIYHGVVTADQAMLERYSGWVPSKRIRAIRNYPLLTESPNDINLSVERYMEKKILFLGGVNENRVAEEFFEALTLLNRNDIEIVMGGLNNSQKLVNKLEKHPFWRNVRFVGTIPSTEIEKLMYSSSISINLFSDSPNHYSVRSNRMFEAMSAGLPMLVSDFPPVRDFVKTFHCGIPVWPHDPVVISEALNQLLDHPREAQRMGTAGRKAACREFSWNREAERLVDFYCVLTSTKT